MGRFKMNNSNKKIVKLNGGLGNQMFQYAFALALSKKLNVEVIFDFRFFEEIKEYKDLPQREYGLSNFAGECKEASTEDLAKIIPNKKYSLLEKLLWQTLRINKYKPCGNVASPRTAYAFNKNLLKSKDYYFYDGYFQNEKYFVDVREDALKAFSLKEPPDEKNQALIDVIKNTASVSIHVRRGDYITLESANKFHGTCSLEYYENAIQYIAKHVQNPHFFLFSDDVKWVVENLKIDYPYTVVDFNQAKCHFDMELMKNCKHNIIANSSFSWWGAWLNKNPKKIVIAPKNWIAANQKCDIVPNEWVKL